MRYATAPTECLACGDGANMLNGRYCRRLGRYVEHDSTPPCLKAGHGKGNADRQENTNNQKTTNK